jgi:tetratricopeptide (TPR) repeat protein
MTADPRTRYYQAIDALNRGDWRTAQDLAMALVKEVPAHAGVHFVAGVAARELLQIPQALECLQNAVRLNPSRPDYIAQLARAWAQASEPGRATELADRAVAMPTDDPVTLDALGLVYTQAHAYAKAAQMFQRVVELQPANARYRFNYATALVQAGDAEGAEIQLAECLAADPRYWKAYTLRSQLRRQSASSNHVAQLQELLAQAGSDPQAVLTLNMALSKEREDLGLYEEALDHLIAGKAALRAGRGDSSSRDKALFEALMETTPSAAVDGCHDPQPIFVFGLPRTGTTLVERIISSHSCVYSAGELQNFGVVFKRATGSTTPVILDIDTVQRSRTLDWRKLGERYIASTRPATAGRGRFVDKLPHNFLYAGYIAAALPDAKMICLRRNPMDSCISNFRQLFAATSHYDYSLDLMDTGRYYLLFDRLMAFWRLHLPGRILEIRYEDVVDDLETSARKLIDFCGLGWEDACMRFEENDAPVATASALQVRSPIYRSSIGRWKRYGKKLDGLRRLLEEEGGLQITA